MDTQQIIDTIKTLNLNVNSESAVKITEEVMKYMYWKMFMEYATGIALAILLAIFLLAWHKISKDKQ